MKYVSTRGGAGSLSFEEVLLAGLASDGGLYVPARWPRLTKDEMRALAGRSYAEVALTLMQPFVGADVSGRALARLIDEAYATFAHPAVAPLVQMGPNAWLLELFHGPTLAFKDVAMQVLARLMDRALRRRKRRATIVVATSGDTGGAAIEAFRGLEAIDIFVLHPKGRVSEMQRRQMTTVREPNVHNIAIEGTFDDAQALVKALFGDEALVRRLQLAGVNSINWARIMAQVVYYFTAALALGAPDRKVRFSVPTGNFGDIFAGYVARRMGLPVARLIIATNENDILARVVKSGRYAPRGVVATASPSMDIQVASNFERLLFELSGRRPRRVRALMTALGERGAFRLNEEEHALLRRDFGAHRVSETETARTIARLREETGYLADPHTAVGVAAARACDPGDGAPMVTLATAHPAKFPDTVSQATGVAVPLPLRLAGLEEREERLSVLGNDKSALTAFILERARAAADKNADRTRARPRAAAGAGSPGSAAPGSSTVELASGASGASGSATAGSAPARSGARA